MVIGREVMVIIYMMTENPKMSYYKIVYVIN